jgi:GAF domain-containing protein
MLATTTDLTDLRRVNARVDALERERNRLLALTEILRDLLGCTHYSDIAQTVTRRLGHLFGLDRGSVFLAAGSGPRRLHLVASYEDPSLRDHVIDLAQYPEIQRALETREIVHLADALTEPSLAPVVPVLTSRRVRSITVVPILAGERVIGALFLRTYHEGPVLSEADHEFCRVVAEVTSRGFRLVHRLEQLQSGGGARAKARSEREQAALLAFLRRLFQAFGHREAAGNGSPLARASGAELDRLVGVVLTALGREARGG